jgi:hypothetical protein
MKGLISLVGVVVMIGIAAGLMVLGLPIGYSVGIACFVTGLASLAVGRLVDDWFDNTNLVTALGWVMLVLAPFMLARAWADSGVELHAVVLILLAVGVEVVLALAGLATFTAIWQGRLRSRRNAERRRLATAQGWRFEPADPSLVSVLGSTVSPVVLGGFLPYSSMPRPVTPGTGAYAVLRGAVNGVEFVAFDVHRPGRFRPAKIMTALVVQLRMDVPPFHSVTVFQLHHGNESYVEADPALVRAVVTPEVVGLTLNQLPSWWLSGRALTATSRDLNRGADNAQLEADLTALASLARTLNWQAIARYTPAPDQAAAPDNS